LRRRKPIRLPLGQKTQKEEHTMDTICDLMQARQDLITAERLGLPVAQVRTVNALEREHEHYERDEPFHVEIHGGGRYVEVCYLDCDDIHRTVSVRADGSLDWTCGGAFPELAALENPA
jgi:hypothetical protein